MCVWGGYSYVRTYEDVPQFWVGFLQESPKHGSHFFIKKIPNYGSDFQHFEILVFFVGKSQEMGTYFWKIP